MAIANDNKNEKYKSALSSSLLQKARVELNEVQSEIPRHITVLRERILQDSNNNFRADDAFLLRFLRARKFDQDRAFKLMSKYYRQREYYPKLFNKTKSELKYILDRKIGGALPNRDSNGRAVLVCFVEHWNTKDISIEDIILLAMLTLEVLIEDEGVQINGVVLILDLKSFNLSHVMQSTPWEVKKAISVLLNAFPVRLKGIHIVNESPIFDGVYQLIKMFLSKKMRKRVVFHGKCLASLHEYLSQEILPEKLGGNVDYSVWNENLLQNFDRISEYNKFGFVHQT